MSKVKIKRGLSDQDMVGHWKETVTFEHDAGKKSPTKPANKKESFFSPELQDKVAKYLLEIKLSLFQQGILDYDIKVSREENQVILTAVPKIRKRDNK